MKKRIAGVLLLFCIVFGLTGCWNRRELHDLGFVGMFGVDKTANGVHATFEIIQPQRTSGNKGGGGSSAGGEKKTSVYVETYGETLYDAVRNTTLKADRKLFFSHTGVFIFSENLAREGLASHMDFIFRDHELRSRTPLLIVADASPSEVMGNAAGIENVPSKYIQGIVKGFKANAKAVDTKTIEFIQMYKAPGINPIAGVIRKVKKQKVTAKDPEYELTNEGAAVFLKDRLVGFLDGEETRGYNWVAGKVKSAIVDCPAPTGQGLTAIEVLHATSKKDITIEDGTIKCNVTVNVTGSLGEETDTANIKENAVTRLIEASAEQTIEQEIERCIMKTQQQYHSDIFGFGQNVHWKYPEVWKNIKADWDDWFSRSEIQVTVKVKLDRVGKIANPIAREGR